MPPVTALVLWAFWSNVTGWVVMPTEDACVAALQAVYEVEGALYPSTFRHPCEKLTREKLTREEVDRKRLTTPVGRGPS